MSCPELTGTITLAWQPIETAPKDGSRFFVHCASWEMPAVAVYCDGRIWPLDDWQNWERDDSIAPPTHWMALPPLPSECTSTGPT